MNNKKVQILYGVYAESEIDDGYGVPVWASVCLFASTKDICERYCKTYQNVSRNEKRRLLVKEIAPFLMEEALLIHPGDLTYLDFDDEHE